MKGKAYIAMLMALTVSVSAQAHRAWILPASTVLSSDQPWVTFDGAVSNNIFHLDHAPLRTEQVSVLAPNGKAVDIQNAHTGKHRSTFDLQLTEAGTYKIFTASSGLRAVWEGEDGKRQMWPGRGQTPNPADFDKAVPKNAKNLNVSQTSRRVETFVTAGAPTEGALQLTKTGFEMKPLTHPNDLFAGETARFQFFIDGEVAEGAKVTVIQGGTRYRDAQNDLELVTDKQGIAEVKWPEAGMYWMEVEYADEKAKAPATKRQGTYVVTLEVLPQ